MRMPTILFYENSTSCCNDSLHKFNPNNYDTFEYATNMLYQTLKNNPTISIELAGHASMKENKPDKLSKKRAYTIRSILVSKGINKKRIQTKSWGTKKMLFKTEQIEKAMNEGEKATLHLKNQRVVFRIVSWDFKE
jgi:outer membrane protein OmpA-like peptidoglycan-associated protein